MRQKFDLVQGFVGVPLLIGVCLLLAIPFLSESFRPVDSHASIPSDDSLEMIAAQGNALVSAIYRYQLGTGLWPSSLEDLSPDWIPAEQTTAWRFDWRPTGWWQLTHRSGTPFWGVQFRYGSDEDGWVLTDGIQARPLKIKPSRPSIPKQTAEQITRRTKHEFTRRIQRYPDKLIHQQGLIYFHYQQKQWTEAEKSCVDCLKQWPEAWWVRVMLARCAAAQGNREIAETHLRQWACKHNDFTHWLFVAQFFHETEQFSAAHQALREAAKHPFQELRYSKEYTDVTIWPPTVYAWCGALMAYRHGWYATALNLCEKWEEYYRAKQRTVDPGFYPIRAACYLSIEKYWQAQEQLDFVPKALDGSNYGWNMHLSGLKAAVEAKKKTFRYDPRDRVDPLRFEYH